MKIQFVCYLYRKIKELRRKRCFQKQLKILKQLQEQAEINGEYNE